MVQTILRLPEVIRATGYSEKAIYKKLADAQDDFPRPVKLGPRAVGWLESEIEAWQLARIEARDTGASSAGEAA
ncbi:helix-turn-helix transcriptional regulator [Sinorhizobium fredii]|uniref:helix-turn-helix transcriptional regulator n=1 Tax=Rhizobium fredii TaxID=380 RepID=UPI0004B9F1CE|nr:AlpA family transcriptional regulator [Sinorhizobium fredii]